MLRGEFDAGAASDPETLLEAYRTSLRETVDRVGVDRAVAVAGVDPETVRAVADGDVGSITLTDAAAILGADPDRPDGDTIAAEARDILLLGMTTAVVDVDTLASALDGQFEAKEIQQMLEGRHRMTLREYAAVHHQLGEHAE